jgi:hypothetical protein
VKTIALLFAVLAASLLTSQSGFAGLAARSPADPPLVDARPRARTSGTVDGLPLQFIENGGQLDERVAYYARGFGTADYFTADGVTVLLRGVGSGNVLACADPADSAAPQRWAVELQFVGARRSKPRGGTPGRGVVSYFKGPREQWHAGLRTYASIVYPDLWPGIDVVYSARAKHFEYRLVIRPGADPNRIKLAYRGTTGLAVTAAGGLEVETPVGALHDDEPAAYQDVDGEARAVPVTYALDGPDSYGFRVGEYDTTRTLTVDPAVFVYAGYVGGSGDDAGAGIAVDDAGCAYITGYTTSTDAFPAAPGPDTSANGGTDAFVAKVSADGTALLYAAYLGGDGEDYGTAIAIDAAGNAYVTGSTTSTEATFPVRVGPVLTYAGGTSVGDAYVAKIAADGVGLAYAGYIGGAGDDVGSGIAVDGTGHAYVTGATNSTEASFPVTKGPDTIYNGGTYPGDAFVAKVESDGSGLVYAGYLGGAGEDVGNGIAVDPTGTAYVTGSTTSDEATFPILAGPDLAANGGVSDAFVAKVSPDGTGLGYAGFIGGSGDDYGRAIAVDGAGSAYVTGGTSSSEATFPVTGGPVLHYNGGGSFSGDAFVAKVTPDGRRLAYAGYIGGAGDDLGAGIAIDDAGRAFVTGFTGSDEHTFPVTGCPTPHYGGNFDAFVGAVAADGALLQAAYLGGAGRDGGAGIALDRAGNAYVVGATTSSEATFPVSVGPGLVARGGLDAFVAKLVLAPRIAGIEPDRRVLWPPNHRMVPITLTISFADGCDSGVSCAIASVNSNEPVSGLGDGDTTPDWAVTGATRLELRAERAGGGHGRVYTIAVRCAGAAGGDVTASVTVTVPHDRPN